MQQNEKQRVSKGRRALAAAAGVLCIGSLIAGSEYYLATPGEFACALRVTHEASSFTLLQNSIGDAQSVLITKDPEDILQLSICYNETPIKGDVTQIIGLPRKGCKEEKWYSLDQIRDRKTDIEAMISYTVEEYEAPPWEKPKEFTEPTKTLALLYLNRANETCTFKAERWGSQLTGTATFGAPQYYLRFWAVYPQMAETFFTRAFWRYAFKHTGH